MDFFDDTRNHALIPSSELSFKGTVETDKRKRGGKKREKESHTLVPSLDSHWPALFQRLLGEAVSG